MLKMSSNPMPGCGKHSQRRANTAIQRAEDLIASIVGRRRSHAGEKPGKMIVEQPVGWSFYR